MKMTTEIVLNPNGESLTILFPQTVSVAMKVSPKDYPLKLQ